MATCLLRGGGGVATLGGPWGVGGWGGGGRGVATAGGRGGGGWWQPLRGGGGGGNCRAVTPQSCQGPPPPLLPPPILCGQQVERPEKIYNMPLKVSKPRIGFKNPLLASLRGKWILFFPESAKGSQQASVGVRGSSMVYQNVAQTFASESIK